MSTALVDARTASAVTRHEAGVVDAAITGGGAIVGREQAERSPYAMAQDGLSELLTAAVHAQRVESMHAAMLVDLIFLTVSYALRAEDAFVAPTLSPARRREMAYRSVTAELATALRVPERTMQRQIDDAYSLSTRLPVTLAALRSGAIGMQHARVVIEATTGLDDDPRLREDLEVGLTDYATQHTAASVRRKARTMREELQAETATDRHLAAQAERRVEIEPALDGMAWLHAYLPASDALLVKSRLDLVAREAETSYETEPSGVERLRAELRTADQIRADAARDLLLYGTLDDETAIAAAAARVRPSVHVTVPVLTLTGATSEPGILDGYGPIDADTARRLTAGAPSFTRLLTHPVTGTVLDVDRTRYRPPADLQRWLQIRDGTCRFPGCNRNARRCDIDHGTPWHEGGRTACDNLCHLCPMHHHLKHETAWMLRHLADGILEWISPAGRTHVTHPAQTMARYGAAPPGTPPGRQGAALTTVPSEAPA
ncbi:DUF222 domain-containing protein [Agromyces sp. NPDC055520]